MKYSDAVLLLLALFVVWGGWWLGRTGMLRWSVLVAAVVSVISLVVVAVFAPVNSPAVPTRAPLRLVVNSGHSGWVNSVAFNPDGKTLVSGSGDGTLRLWHTASGRELRVLRGGHTHGVEAISISPDGKTVVSIGVLDGTLRLWDVTSGRELMTFKGHTSSVNAVAFSPDGKTLVSGSDSKFRQGSDDNNLRLLDVASGRELGTFKGHTSSIHAVAFSPDGKTVVSGSKSDFPRGSDDNNLQLWDVASGRELGTFKGHTCSIDAVAFSPDGKTVVSYCDEEVLQGSDAYNVRLWDVASGTELKTFRGHTSSVSAIAFSPDGRTVISSSRDATLRLWDVATGRELKKFGGYTRPVNLVTFGADGKTVAFGSDVNILRLWELTGGREVRPLFGGTKETVSLFALSPDRKTAVSGSHDGTLRLWDVLSGRERRRLSAGTKEVALSLDFTTVVSRSDDGMLRLLDVLSRRELKPLRGQAKTIAEERLIQNGVENSVTSVAFSTDGKTVVSGNLDGTLRLWDVRSGKEQKPLSGHSNTIASVHFSRTGDFFSVTSAAFSPDGKTVVSGYQDGELHLWDTASGRELVDFNKESGTSEVAAVAFSPDGKAVASVGSDAVHLWDVATGRELRFLTDHTKSGFNSVAFSPAGNTLVSGSDDGTLRLWEVASGRQLRSFTGHGQGIESVAFSTDGRYVVSSSDDGRIKLWRVSDGKELATLISFTDGTWVVTDPEGRFDTADLESMPHLHWVMPDDPFTPVPLEAFMKDYYEPRLLARILAGQSFKTLIPLISLNTTQPEVQIAVAVADASDPSLVKVTVSATGATKSYLQNKKEVPRPTAVHDLRLFRDGQVVGYADGKLADFKGAAFTKTFTVRLPKDKAGKDVVFSAYAFNDDRVKSETVRSTYKAPALPSSTVASKGKAYVISMGVNSHDNTAWNLNFAANDARLVRQSVSERLAKLSQYKDVIAITLVSDNKDHQASKAALHAVLDRLAGKPLDAAASALLKTIQGADKLQAITPDDLFLLSFSGHGFADDSGNFYLIPQDTGTGSGKTVTAQLRQHSISSEELSQWLRDVDAGDMTMIVDACQSAATVGNDFKPGPMGSRGLGQLSFDKGMRILAASQADEYALEDGKLQQGLLSFSLVNDGLNAFNADREPKDGKIMLDEWLRYGVYRVPSLAEEMKTGKVVIAGKGTTRAAVSFSADGAKPARPTQQPALFDFAKKRKAVELAREATP